MQAIIHTNERMRIATQSAHEKKEHNNEIWRKKNVDDEDDNVNNNKILTNYHTLWLWFLKSRHQHMTNTDTRMAFAF